MNEIAEYHYKNENYSIYCEEYRRKLDNDLADIFDAKEVLLDYFTKYPAYTKKLQDIKKNLKDYGIYTKDISYIKEYKAQAFFPVYDETNNNAFALIGLGEIYYTKRDYKKTLELCKQILNNNIIEEDNYFLSAILYKLYALSLLKSDKEEQAEKNKEKIESVLRKNREYNLIKLICYKGLIEYYIECKKNKNQDLSKDKSLVKRIIKELNKYIF